MERKLPLKRLFGSLRLDYRATASPPKRPLFGTQQVESSSTRTSTVI